MMTAKKKVAVAAAFGLAVVALYLLWPTGAALQESPAPGRSSPSEVAPVVAAVVATPAPEGAPSETTQREVLATPGTTGRGDLVVRVLYGDDHSPAADVMVTAFRKNEIPRNASAPSVDSKRRRTDAQGIARFPSMRAGRTGLIADRGHWFENAHVDAGKEAFVEFVMPVGVTITGVVVSAAGAPVAGADVELDSFVVAMSDAQGRFTVRGAAPHGSISARALGHGASKSQTLMPNNGRAEVRVELGVAGGIVEGTVRDPDGKPLADVRVVIGSWESRNSMVADAPPRPARPRTDADGHFRAVGIPLGEQPMTSRAPGMVPWSGKCQVTAEALAVMDVSFARGNTLRGSLRDADGHPFGDVLLGARQGELDWDEVINPDGTFELSGLPDGEIDVKVDAEARGKAQARVAMVPGGVTTCELTLECGFVAKGKVRDEAGQGVAKVNVSWWTAQPSLHGYTYTDQDGAFTITNAPEGKTQLQLYGEAIADAQFKLDLRAGELDLRVQRRAPKSVYIQGVVLDPDGRPALAQVWASGGGSSGIDPKATDTAGYFEIGPVPPGDWHLSIESRTFPRLSFERRQLEANTRWDVGTVRLAAGGDVCVVVVEGDVEGAWFSIQDDQQRWFGGLDVQRGRSTSEQLPVGNYRLFASGKTKAAQGIPFAIRAGETTRVDVRVRAGVRQRFDIALPEKVEKPSGSLRILRGADVVANTWASREEGKPCTAEACLQSGDYIVAAKFGDLEGSVKFTVGEREGEPVRVEVAQPRK